MTNRASLGPDFVLKEAEKGSISIAFVREALEGVLRRSIAPEPLLRAAGIPPGLLQFSDSRVTPESFGALWLAIARALADEFFGRASRRMKVGSYAVMCRRAWGCQPLGGAAAIICEFLRVILDDTQVELIVAGTDARIVFNDRV